MSKSDSPIGSRGKIREPITGQDPCIVRPPSHLKMQGVLNLDSCWKTRAWMTKVSVIRYLSFPDLRSTPSDILGMLSISIFLTFTKMHQVEKTIGKYPGTLVREYTSYLHAASCQETGNVNCHIARHDDTRCMYYVLRTIVTDPIPLGRS